MSESDAAWPMANYLSAWKTFRHLGNEPAATAETCHLTATVALEGQSSDTGCWLRRWADGASIPSEDAEVADSRGGRLVGP